ncbi:MAG: hypothetical protein IE937_12715, partial [Gammaproteobacteria bacterium]|nr:hypothetical protein [Gammaproteobacteria bacterium]
LIPCRGVVKSNWKPIVQQAAPETLSGASDVIEIARSFWKVEFEFELPKQEDYDVILSFLADRNGSDFSFTSPRHFRRLPRDKSITSDAGITLNAVNIAHRTVRLGGVGTGMARRGDMVSYRTLANGYWIGIATADAAPVGGVVTIPVWPEPMTPHASAPSPRRIDALGEFKLKPNTEPRWSEKGRRRSVSFTAKQVVR